MKEQKIEVSIAIILFFGGIITFVGSMYNQQKLYIEQFTSSKVVSLFVQNSLSWKEIVSLIITLIGFFWFAFNIKIAHLLKNREFDRLTDDVSDKVLGQLLGQSVKETMVKYEEILSKGKFHFATPESSKLFSLTVLQSSTAYKVNKIYSTWNITILNRSNLIDKLFDLNSDIQKAWSNYLSIKPYGAKRIIYLNNQLISNNEVINFVTQMDKNNKSITRIYNVEDPSLQDRKERDYMLCFVDEKANYILQGGLSESGDSNYDGFLEKVTIDSPEFERFINRFELDYKEASEIDNIKWKKTT